MRWRQFYDIRYTHNELNKLAYFDWLMWYYKRRSCAFSFEYVYLFDIV